MIFVQVKDTELDRLRRGLSGRYHIGPEIGVGGMSTVYRATDIRHDRDVAIKLLAGPSALNLGQRFLREIRITAKLQHPHVLPLLDSGTVGPLHFFVTPYIAGHSLSHHLSAGGPIPVGEALRLTKEVAGALAHAHENNIAHLDVKPANILLSGTHAMVADFGIARAVSENCGDTGGHGVPAGTPSYMSPEQVSGSSCLDGRSDVYSLACVLFEMLTGEPPFGPESSAAVLSKHLHADPPSVKQRRSSVPRYVDRAIRRALAKDPAQRFQSMRAFVDALKPQAVGIATRRRFARLPSRMRVAGASIAIAMLSAFGYGFAKSEPPQRTQEQADPLVLADPHIAGLDEAGDVLSDVQVNAPKDPALPC